jgi:hypothetical protein
MGMNYPGRISRYGRAKQRKEYWLFLPDRVNRLTWLGRIHSANGHITTAQPGQLRMLSLATVGGCSLLGGNRKR